ncbi:hypothetical protein GCM10027591_01890 [Zhihengliuella somnathii]
MGLNPPAAAEFAPSATAKEIEVKSLYLFYGWFTVRCCFTVLCGLRSRSGLADDRPVPLPGCGVRPHVILTARPVTPATMRPERISGAGTTHSTERDPLRPISPRGRAIPALC